MEPVTKITKDNLHDVVADMKRLHQEMLAWSKANRNDIGGIYGAVSAAMGEPEILEGLEELLEPLLVYPEFYYVQRPTFVHEERTISTRRRKERSVDDMVTNLKNILKEGKAVFLRDVQWQKPYEMFGVKTEGFAMTQFALMARPEVVA